MTPIVDSATRRTQYANITSGIAVNAPLALSSRSSKPSCARKLIVPVCAMHRHERRLVGQGQHVMVLGVAVTFINNKLLHHPYSLTTRTPYLYNDYSTMSLLSNH